jgi:quercetin dioxygenase-like cupin family protein
MFIPCSGTKSHDALPGVVRRQAALAEGVQLIEFRMSRGAVIPWHDHVNEQVGMVVSGRIVLTIGEDAMTLGPGDGYVIPSGVEHTVEVLEDSVALDVFSPPRDDYRDFVP